MRRWMARLLGSLERRWVLLAADVVVIFVALVLAMLARSVTGRLNWEFVLQFGALAVVMWVPLNRAFGLYRRMWQYESASGVLAIAASALLGTLILAVVDVLSQRILPHGRAVPLGAVLLTGFFVLSGFTAVRYRRRLWTGLLWRWDALRGRFPKQRTRTLIVGAGDAGQQLARHLRHHPKGRQYEVVGFVDDDARKRGMIVHGVTVLGDRRELPGLVAQHRVELIVIAIHRITGSSFRELLDLCESTSARIKVVPDVLDLLGESEGAHPLRDVTAADLLGREPVEVDQEACRALIAGRRVLVTGAAGSIGAELCRQVLGYGPSELVMLDTNESDLHDLQVELDTRLRQQKVGGGDRPHLWAIVGDVCRWQQMDRLMRRCRPQVVFHAAAYKHVPLMEAYPEEAVRVNLGGTLNMVKLAGRHQVERFVFISTDKAVNPSSVMGATKRVGEKLVVTAAEGAMGVGSALSDASLAAGKGGGGTWLLNCTDLPSGGPTLFTAVRFGNVLGSRGSVVPTFERQIEQGGPVTVTHPEVTRYFISLTEAVALVIQAATLTRGGDLFMLDMGQQIRIEELARRLVRLRGLRPDVDIAIQYVGLRPGEKLEEELTHGQEVRCATPHPRVFQVSAPCPQPWQELEQAVAELLRLADAQDQEALRAGLWRLVEQQPELEIAHA